MNQSLVALEKLRTDLENLEYGDCDAFKTLLSRVDMIIRCVFGDSSKYKYLGDMRKIRACVPGVDATELDIKDFWHDGHPRFVNLVSTMISQLESFGSVQSSEDGAQKEKVEQLASHSVFIVHGHDEGMRESVARMVEKLGLTAVILHERPDQGRTVIEKLEDISGDAAFAIVLLSPDDSAYPRGEDPEHARPRARQNVILELGFFLAKLGRSRVVPLYRAAEGFELPSDMEGVLYTRYDNAGAWRSKIVQELGAAGYEVDANRLT